MKATFKILLMSLLIFVFGVTSNISSASAKHAKRQQFFKRQQVVKIAKKYLGVPYVWGSSSPRGFDCSGLVKYVYAKIHIYLPHYTYSIYRYGRYINRRDLLPGDLVFFGGLSHMGMYIGDGKFIHAPRTGDYVKISYLNDRSNYYGARRII